MTATKVGTATLATNTYNQYTGALTKTTYGNGDSVSFGYNGYGLPISVNCK